MASPTYRITTILNKPFMMIKSDGSFQGFIVDLLDELSKRAGFKYNVQVVRDGTYGSLLPNGSWSGMIGEVMRQKADIAAAPLTVTATRERVVDFTKTFLADSRTFLVKTKSSPTAPLNYVFEPFTDTVWISIVAALVIVSILFMLIGRFSPYEWRQVPADKDPRGARHSFGLRESLMFVFTTASLQGYRETPRSLAGRVLAVFWFIFIFLLVVTYIGVVVTFAIANASSGPMRRIFPFNDINDILRQNTVKVGVLQGSSTYKKLEDSSVDVYKKLAETIAAENSFVKSYKDGVEKVRNSDGNFVMLMDSLLAEYKAENDCSLVVHGGSHFPSEYGLAVKKGSPIKAKLDAAILQLKESGTIQMLKQRWWNIGKCMGPDTDSENRFKFSARIHNIYDLKTHFIFLLVGVIFAMLTLAGEILFKKFRK